MEYYSATKKNTFESVLMRWMKLEPVIQSEVSQKEKHQYSILNGNPLQYSCLENPMGGGAWWDCWVIWQFYFQVFKESPHCSP